MSFLTTRFFFGVFIGCALPSTCMGVTDKLDLWTFVDFGQAHNDGAAIDFELSGRRGRRIFESQSAPVLFASPSAT